MTPLWEELAGQTPDAAAAIKVGENAQVSSHGDTNVLLWVGPTDCSKVSPWKNQKAFQYQ